MKIKNVSFNVNGEVKVRLEEKAKEYLESEYVKHGGVLKLDKEGYYHTQLWCLIQELGSMMSLVWSPIKDCEIIFDEIDVKATDEMMKEVRYECKEYIEVVMKEKINIEYIKFLGKVCSYYGYTIDDLKKKLILSKEDMARLNLNI